MLRALENCQASLQNALESALPCEDYMILLHTHLLMSDDRLFFGASGEATQKGVIQGGSP